MSLDLKRVKVGNRIIYNAPSFGLQVLENREQDVFNQTDSTKSFQAPQMRGFFIIFTILRSSAVWQPPEVHPKGVYSGYREDGSAALRISAKFAVNALILQELNYTHIWLVAGVGYPRYFRDIPYKMVGPTITYLTDPVEGRTFTYDSAADTITFALTSSDWKVLLSK
ncbi:hypothetical protein FOL47_010115 [Perkinsus chesapeaki]|uniref:Uncharacterized protein n=1 Tax=Perkinsus chesapeaki TaxID=330153 RepID=A0A7J6L4L7_PERCH|nr:hypothetical protein FOL47_010115 [Perkinsus chesapeaki]